MADVTGLRQGDDQNSYSESVEKLKQTLNGGTSPKISRSPQGTAKETSKTINETINNSLKSLATVKKNIDELVFYSHVDRSKIGENASKNINDSIQKLETNLQKIDQSIHQLSKAGEKTPLLEKLALAKNALLINKKNFERQKELLKEKSEYTQALAMWQDCTKACKDEYQNLSSKKFHPRECLRTLEIVLALLTKLEKSDLPTDPQAQTLREDTIHLLENVSKKVSQMASEKTPGWFADKKAFAAAKTSCVGEQLKIETLITSLSLPQTSTEEIKPYQRVFGKVFTVDRKLPEQYQNIADSFLSSIIHTKVRKIAQNITEVAVDILKLESDIMKQLKEMEKFPISKPEEKKDAIKALEAQKQNLEKALQAYKNELLERSPSSTQMKTSQFLLFWQDRLTQIDNYLSTLKASSDSTYVSIVRAQGNLMKALQEMEKYPEQTGKKFHEIVKQAALLTSGLQPTEEIAIQLRDMRLESITSMIEEAKDTLVLTKEEQEFRTKLLSGETTSDSKRLTSLIEKSASIALHKTQARDEALECLLYLLPENSLVKAYQTKWPDAVTAKEVIDGLHQLSKLLGGKNSEELTPLYYSLKNKIKELGKEQVFTSILDTIAQKGDLVVRRDSVARKRIMSHIKNDPREAQKSAKSDVTKFAHLIAQDICVMLYSKNDTQKQEAKNEVEELLHLYRGIDPTLEILYKEVPELRLMIAEMPKPTTTKSSPPPPLPKKQLDETQNIFTEVAAGKKDAKKVNDTQLRQILVSELKKAAANPQASHATLNKFLTKFNPQQITNVLKDDAESLTLYSQHSQTSLAADIVLQSAHDQIKEILKGLTNKRMSIFSESEPQAFRFCKAQSLLKEMSTPPNNPFFIEAKKALDEFANTDTCLQLPPDKIALRNKFVEGRPSSDTNKIDAITLVLSTEAMRAMYLQDTQAATNVGKILHTLLQSDPEVYKGVFQKLQTGFGREAMHEVLTLCTRSLLGTATIRLQNLEGAFKECPLLHEAVLSVEKAAFEKDPIDEKIILGVYTIFGEDSVFSATKESPAHAKIQELRKYIQERVIQSLPDEKQKFDTLVQEAKGAANYDDFSKKFGEIKTHVDAWKKAFEKKFPGIPHLTSYIEGYRMEVANSGTMPEVKRKEFFEKIKTDARIPEVQATLTALINDLEKSTDVATVTRLKDEILKKSATLFEQIKNENPYGCKDVLTEQVLGIPGPATLVAISAKRKLALDPFASAYKELQGAFSSPPISKPTEQTMKTINSLPNDELTYVITQLLEKDDTKTKRKELSELFKSIGAEEKYTLLMHGIDKPFKERNASNLTKITSEVVADCLKASTVLSEFQTLVTDLYGNQASQLDKKIGTFLSSMEEFEKALSGDASEQTNECKKNIQSDAKGTRGDYVLKGLSENLSKILSAADSQKHLQDLSLEPLEKLTQNLYELFKEINSSNLNLETKETDAFPAIEKFLARHIQDTSARSSLSSKQVQDDLFKNHIGAKLTQLNTHLRDLFLNMLPNIPPSQTRETFLEIVDILIKNGDAMNASLKK